MMPRVLSLLLLTLSSAILSTGTVLNGTGTGQPSCRYLPGDQGWPSEESWARLNTTVGGRLLVTNPVAHVCHRQGPFAAYDQVACEHLQTAFLDAGPQTLSVLSHVETVNRSILLTALHSFPVPGEIFNPFWQNQSCSPFTAPEMTCELGNRAVYSINVTGPADVQAGLRFAKENNVRLVIRNTGIE